VEVAHQPGHPAELEIRVEQVEVVRPHDRPRHEAEHLPAALVEPVRARRTGEPDVVQVREQRVHGRRPWSRRPPHRLSDADDPATRVSPGQDYLVLSHERHDTTTAAGTGPTSYPKRPFT
jgi:hypothetical protein